MAYNVNEFIPLSTLKIGGRRYNSKSFRDIVIKYDKKTYSVHIKVQVEGENGAPKGTYMITRISGEALMLHSVNGSLKDMVVKMFLETADLARFENDDQNLADHVRCNMVAVEANVEQAGRLRELLMMLHGETLLQGRNAKFYEGIPQWCLALPWWLYSKRLRIFIQKLLMFFTIFNTFWALWQLYRHVDVIQATLEPIINTLHKVSHIYITFAAKIVDFGMDVFSCFWWHFFAPFQVLAGPLWSPLVELLPSLYSMSMTAPWMLWNMISTLLVPISWLLWTMFLYVLHPLFSIIEYVPGLRRTVSDPVKLLGRNLLIDSFKSVGSLLLWTAKLARIYKYKHSEKTKEEPNPDKVREPQFVRRQTVYF